MKRAKLRLGQLQLRIMQVLWERGPARVGDVQEALEGGDAMAYTTVATMLRKMEARGLVTHDNEGRSFIYRADVSQDDVTRSMSDDLMDRVFEGSLTDMVSHLLTTREVSADELKQLERLIAERRKRS